MQKRSYRKHQPSVGDSVETRKKENTEGRRDRSGYDDTRRDKGRDDKRRRHGDERYRDSRERSRELYDRDTRKRDLLRDHGSSSKRRDERYDTLRRSRSPILPPQQYELHDRHGSYKFRDHSRGKEKVSQDSRKRSKGYVERRPKERQVSRIQSGSESEGEISPPTVKKRSSDVKDVYVKSLIQDLESTSSNESEVERSDSAHTPSNSQSPEGTDDSRSSSQGANTETGQTKTWRDIAEESSGSDSEKSLGSEKEKDDDLKFSQMSENFFKYSGIQSVSSSEIDEPEKETAKASPIKPESGEEPMDEEKPNMAEEEKEEGEEEEQQELPPYLPALMGCRSVECYEWLNRIEEGTYGVVFRGKDKRTGG